MGYLLDKGLTTFIINPLRSNFYRKSLSFRKTKTDKVDAHTIATIHMASVFALQSEFPSASVISSAHLTKLTNLLETAFKGHYSKDTLFSFVTQPELLLALICLLSH